MEENRSEVISAHISLVVEPPSFRTGLPPFGRAALPSPPRWIREWTARRIRVGEGRGQGATRRARRGTKTGVLIDFLIERAMVWKREGGRRGLCTLRSVV